MDGEGRFPIGDVNHQTMLEVYENFTHRHHTSRKELPVCKTCSY
jgi:hypothetical protein